MANESCESCSVASCSAQKAQPGETNQQLEERRAVQRRLCRIKHVVTVLSGKGGVGKSTIAVNLATTLMLAGKQVGLLDVDIHGPSIPIMLGLHDRPVAGEDGAMVPLQLGDLKVMSIGLLLNKPDDAVIWRGPMKIGVIRQFLADVEWEDLDYLIIDCPPGTGDEPLSVCQMIEKHAGAIVVTTPQEVAAADVSKSINFCRQLNMPVLGLVENMSGFVCPHCGETSDIFPPGAGEQMALKYDVPLLGRIPVEPGIGIAGDAGTPFVQRCAGARAAEVFQQIVDAIVAKLEG